MDNINITELRKKLQDVREYRITTPGTYYVDSGTVVIREDKYITPDVVSNLLDELDELRHFNKEVNKRVMPGLSDTSDAMLSIMKERDTLLADWREMKDAISNQRCECDPQERYVCERCACLSVLKHKEST